MSIPSALSTRRLRQSEPGNSEAVISLAVSPIEQDLSFLQRMFDDSNWKLHTAHTYKEAMAQFTEQIPIVICENKLPDGDWKDVLSRLAPMLEPPRFIVTSRHADERLWAEVVNCGAFDLLATPFCEIEVGYAIGSAWLDWKSVRDRMQTAPPVFASSNKSAPIGMETILVMDDEATNRVVISAVLHSDGYHVLEAATGGEAIDIFKNCDETIALLVADVNLPDISGTEVAVKLVESSPDSAVLFISGNPVTAWTRTQLSALDRLPTEAVGFLEKPFTRSTLEEKVRGLLDRHSRSKPHALAYL